MVQTSTKNQSLLQSFVGAVLMTFIGIFVKRGLKKRLFLQIQSKFAGEDALDAGGVSREFYTGRQSIKILCR